MLDSSPVAAACEALVTVPVRPVDHDVHQTVYREDDLVPALLPPVFRVVNLTRLPGKPGAKVYTEATLYHREALLRVFWLAPHVDVTLKVGSLVSIRWHGRAQSVDGAVRISRLVALSSPMASLNLFDTVPTEWVRDSALVSRATALWSQLTPAMQALINAVLWDGGRFQRYVSGPSSLNGHHNGVNGNFRHAVEVAELALTLATTTPQVSVPVLITAALLHDAGKADEYVLKPGMSGFQMSTRGILVGHRHTILEWLAVARLQCRMGIPEAHYLALLHALTAAKGAEWLGIREPVSLEATTLSMADRLSGQADLFNQTGPEHTGFGRYHKHLKGRPFVVATESTDARAA